MLPPLCNSADELQRDQAFIQFDVNDNNLRAPYMNNAHRCAFAHPRSALSEQT